MRTSSLGKSLLVYFSPNRNPDADTLLQALFTVTELRDLQKLIGRLRLSRSKKDIGHVLYSRMYLFLDE